MALRFNGSTGYVASTGTLNTGLFTHATWVYVESYTTGGITAAAVMGISQGVNNTVTDKNVWIDSTGHLNGYVFDGAPKQVAGVTVIPLGKWVHVAVFNDGSNLWVYQDGVAVGAIGAGSAASFAGTILLGGGFRLVVGGVDPGAANYGNIRTAQSATWSVGLTPAEIKRLAQGTDPSNVRRGSLRWHIRGDFYEGTTIIDSSPFGDTGTITGGVISVPAPPPILVAMGSVFAEETTSGPDILAPFLDVGTGLFTPALSSPILAPFLNVGTGLNQTSMFDGGQPPFVPPPLPPSLGTGSSGGTVPVGPGQPLPPLSSGGLAGIRFYQGPPWRWLITDLDGVSITFLDHLAVEAEVTYTLDKPWEARLTMPADNPEVNIPHTDGDPFVSEGNRLLYGFRREGDTPKWVCRFAGKVLQVEDTGETEDARTVITAWDPWQILYQRPMVNYVDEFPDQTAPKTGGPGTFFSFDDTQVGGIAGLFLRNTIVNQGSVHIDMGDTTPTWSTDGPPDFNPVQLPGTSYWGGPYTAVWSGRTKSLIQTTTQVDCDTQQGLMVGEVWDQMLEYGSLDLMLTPIYDPLRRPGITSELSIYNRVGAPQYDAVFAWDKPGRNVKSFNSLRDGTKRANTIRYYSEQGGPPVGGGIPISDGASILKYEETWHEQFWVGRIQAAAFAMAELQLELLANGIHTVEISPAPERMPFAFTEWFLGDTVPVYTSNKARQENIGFQRIYGIVLNIDENSYEQVPQVLASPDSA